ncbi:ribosomal protein S18 acetylase RimI-like enzyme [Salsuginibacillus halophilus]|uniref:Ribosomal protein S18 acetylase RimI-like enzyme n=1 Tax=Salsuginibacillus halophilus TaxID=517424 RepID=A0A2P8HXF3_9BACI|nr:GNAT family N-acetyltransferase [Salsuginibacillus halophilus]PSL50887.1 ribosomal protein S18 acetylase RimI-like enzyme [Salsuginibacillus halophilus]
MAYEDGLQIRRMIDEDIHYFGLLLEQENHIQKEYISKEQMKNLKLEDERFLHLAAVTEDGALTGVGIFARDAIEVAWVVYIIVAKPWQKHGVASMLLKASEQMYVGLTSLFAEVHTENREALTFFERHGFEVIQKNNWGWRNQHSGTMVLKKSLQ